MSHAIMSRLVSHLVIICQARREPQQGPEKHSREPPNIFTGPLWEKYFEFLLFKMVHSSALYISGRRRGPQTSRGPK